MASVTCIKFISFSRTVNHNLANISRFALRSAKGEPGIPPRFACTAALKTQGTELRSSATASKLQRSTFRERQGDNTTYVAYIFGPKRTMTKPIGVLCIIAATALLSAEALAHDIIVGVPVPVTSMVLRPTAAPVHVPALRGGRLRRPPTAS